MKLQPVWQEALSRAKPGLPRLLLTFGLLCLGVGGVMLFSRSFLEEEKFDLRGAASVAQGLVDYQIATPSALTAGQRSTFRVKVNTHNTQVVGLQLVLSIEGSAKVAKLDAKIVSGSGLQISHKEVRANKELVIIALPNQIAGPYSNNSWQDWLEIEITPQYGGNLDLVVDNTRSKSLLYHSSPPKDVLNQVSGWSLAVGGVGPGITIAPGDCPTPPTNFTATKISASQIKLTWQDNNRSRTKYQLFLAELGEPPNGGRALDKIEDNIAASAREYTWTIPQQYQTRRYYRFLLNSINGSCETAVRSNEILSIPTTVGSALNLTFRQQGVNRAGVNTDAMVSLKPKNQVNANWVSIYAPFTSEANGLFTPNYPVPLDQFNILPNEPYQIAVKTQHSLNKILGEIKLDPLKTTTAPNSWSDKPLSVGDFAHAGNSFNQIDIADIGLMLSQFTQLNITITDQFAQFDVNYDGSLNLADVSLVLANYTELIIKGDGL